MSSFIFQRLTSTHRRLLIALCAMLLLQSGCSSPISRFLTRMVDRINDPIERVHQRIEQPILPTVGLSVLWIGHASMLIQIDDKVFLTDPVFTNFVGMFARRIVEPGIDPLALDRVDYILICHIHLDHFSYGSLDILPKTGRLLIPIGGAEYTPDFGFSEIREMKPWEVLEQDGVRITAVPVQHFGGRYGFDILWMRDRGYTGYVIECHGKTVFIAGDTGYHPELFKDMGKRFSIDVALLPIAPIEPRDFMQQNHVDPAEAVQIFEDLGARVMIPMHHRTFSQGLDPSPTYARDLLQEIAEQKNLHSRIRIPEIGERLILKE